MLNVSLYGIKASFASSSAVSSLWLNRYSILTSSPLLSLAVIVTVCASLKNKSKVILLNNSVHVCVPILISPVGGSLSTKTLTLCFIVPTSSIVA